MTIDTTATEPPRNWFLDIASAPTEDLLREATGLRAKLAIAQQQGHRVDARAYELRLLDVERAIAIHNRRATEAEDQRAAAAERNREPEPCAEGECKHAYDDWPAGSVTQRDREFDQCLSCGWTEADAKRHRTQPALTTDGVRAAVIAVAMPLLGAQPAISPGLAELLSAEIAARVAEKLAGRVVSAEQRDRIVTIADEAFGLGPVEPLDATLTRIERGIHEQHKRLANLETQREADLREALSALTFEVAEKIAQWMLDAAESPSTRDIPQHDRNAHDYLCWAAYQIRTGAWREGWERDPAKDDPFAAEYARGKAGE